jgi:hypothetical protein
MVERTEVPALHDDDVAAFLERIGVRSAYESGELRCVVCGASLRESGLGAARTIDGEVVFACTKLDCLDDFHAP